MELQLSEGTVFELDDNSYPMLDYHKNVSRRDMIGTLFIMSNEGLVKAGAGR